jgi:hypothetical protein
MAILATSARVLGREHWPEDIDSQLTFGENEENCQLDFN